MIISSSHKSHTVGAGPKFYSAGSRNKNDGGSTSSSSNSQSKKRHPFSTSLDWTAKPRKNRREGRRKTTTKMASLRRSFVDDSGEGNDKVPDNLSETSSVVTAKGRVSPVPSSNASNPSSTPTSASLRGRFGSMTHMKINEDDGLESNGKGGELGAGVPVPDGSEAVMGSETGEAMSLGFHGRYFSK